MPLSLLLFLSNIKKHVFLSPPMTHMFVKGKANQELNKAGKQHLAGPSLWLLSWVCGACKCCFGRCSKKMGKMRKEAIGWFQRLNG